MANRADTYREELRQLDNWEPYLKRHSGLPGPRANLELVAAVADEADADRLWRLSASQDEFLALCGTAGLGRIALLEPETVISVRSWQGCASRRSCRVTRTRSRCSRSSTRSRARSPQAATVAGMGFAFCGRRSVMAGASPPPPRREMRSRISKSGFAPATKTSHGS